MSHEVPICIGDISLIEKPYFGVGSLSFGIFLVYEVSQIGNKLFTLY